MSGFWIPIMVLILKTGNIGIAYSTDNVFDTEKECMHYQEQNLKLMEPEFAIKIQELKQTCLYIPDTRSS